MARCITQAFAKYNRPECSLRSLLRYARANNVAAHRRDAFER